MEKKNDVASFLYYMWNSWCKEECIRAFQDSPCGWVHLWDKWVCCIENNNRWGAVEEFFAELSQYNQDLLVRRAVQVYDRRTRL